MMYNTKTPHNYVIGAYITVVNKVKHLFFCCPILKIHTIHP